MGLQLNYFYTLTPRQFFNTVNGYRKREENLSQERWAMTRKIMWATAFPHCKDGLQENQLLKLDFLDKVENKRTEEETKKLIEETEDVKDFWKLQDEKRKSQTQ